MGSHYQFRTMVADDLPQVRRWLETPHVAAWWHDPADQFELVSADLSHPGMRQFIVMSSERPFAYLQCYDLSDWNTGFGEQPVGTRGVDQFIGEAEMIGRGHGSAFIRAFIGDLLTNGVPRIVTDPDPNNGRAIRAYEKAGFRKDRLVDTPDGRALLMVCDA